METASISTHIDALSSNGKGRSFTDDEYNDYIEHLNKLDEVAIDQFETDDFFVDLEGNICNSYCYDGCSFLFVAWLTETVPVMVYNRSAVCNLSPAEKEEWVDIWGHLFYKKSPENANHRNARIWKSILKKLEPHIWQFQVGKW